MNVLIVEDELFSAERLQRQLSQIDSSINVLNILPSVEKSIAWFSKNPDPDLIFLDIHLEDQILLLFIQLLIQNMHSKHSNKTASIIY